MEIKNEPPKVKDRPNGLLNYAEEFGPITHGESRRCDLTPANMATGVSALRAVTVSGATYAVQGKSLGGFEAFAEEIIGISKGDGLVNVVFVYGGDIVDAIKKLKPGGVLVVMGLAQGHPMRPEWMKVRQYGNALLQRFCAPTMGPDRSGDIGIGIIEGIRVEAFGIVPERAKKPVRLPIQTQAVPGIGETISVIDRSALPEKVDGRRGGRTSYRAGGN